MKRGSEKLIDQLPQAVYVLPNVIPWNKLLLDGKLRLNYGDNRGGVGVETREYPWPWATEQPFSDYILLYNSSRSEEEILRLHGIAEKQPEKAVVGLGLLILVRHLTELEKAEWMLRAHNMAVTRKNMQFAESGLLPGEDYGPAITAGAWDLVFSDLWEFEKPVKIDWPAGPVKSLRIKTADIRGQLLSASIVRRA